MNKIQIEFNKYGDCILSIPTLDDYSKLTNYIQLKKDQTYNLKIGEKFTECPKGFKYITKRDNTYIYASKNVYQKCYHIYNGQIFGAACIVEFVCNDKQYICLVKDKFKNTISNPEGSSDYTVDDGITPVYKKMGHFNATFLYIHYLLKISILHNFLNVLS